VATNLNKAPLVIKKRKTTRIRFQGEQFGTRDTLVLDMGKQGLSDIQYLMKLIAVEETEKEANAGNEPTFLVVDGKEGAQVSSAQRKIEVFFGTELEQLMIRTVQRSLSTSIKANGATSSDRALGSSSLWEWGMAATPKDVAVKVNINQVTHIPRGAYLVLKPKSNMVGLADMFAARKDAGWDESTWGSAAHAMAIKAAETGKYGDADRRSGGVGFMSKAVSKIKRTRLMRNFTMFASFTQDFKLRDELYSHGTPVIVIKAKRYKRYKRIKVK